MWTRGVHAWLTSLWVWLWRHMSTVCLFISYAFPLILFSSLFPYPLSYFSFPLRIDPLRFWAGCLKRWLNLALVFRVILCCSIGECVLLLCQVWFFLYQAKRLAWGNVSKMTYFVSSGTSHHNTINQSQRLLQYFREYQANVLAYFYVKCAVLHLLCNFCLFFPPTIEWLFVWLTR